MVETPSETLANRTTVSGYSYEDLMRAPFRKPQPVVGGLVHEGHTAVFAGAFGQGKTFFGLQLSVSLAIGRDFLGRKITRPYRTVFVDADNGKGEIKDRVATLVSTLNLSEPESANLFANWRLEDYEDEGPLHLLNLAKAEGFESACEVPVGFVQAGAEIVINSYGR